MCRFVRCWSCVPFHVGCGHVSSHLCGFWYGSRGCPPVYFSRRMGGRDIASRLHGSLRDASSRSPPEVSHRDLDRYTASLPCGCPCVSPSWHSWEVCGRVCCWRMAHLWYVISHLSSQADHGWMLCRVLGWRVAFYLHGSFHVALHRDVCGKPCRMCGDVVSGQVVVSLCGETSCHISGKHVVSLLCGSGIESSS